SVQGTSQVSGAIIASTVTTIVVFLPIVYLHGTAGELFKDQAWTVAFSLLSSLVVAILVIPMLSTRFLKKYSAIHLEKRSIQFPRYRKILAGILKKKLLVICCAVLMIALALRLIPVVGSEFIPKTDLNDFSIEIKLPEGTELYRTENVVNDIEQYLDEILGNDLKTMYSIIGSSDNPGENESSVLIDENTANIKFTLKKDHEIPSEDVLLKVNSVLDDIPDMEAQFIHDQTALELTLGTESAPVVIEIQGEDLDYIQQLTEKTKQQVLTIDDLFNVETNFDEGRPEINIVIDRVRAGLQNIGIDQLSSQLQIQLMGTDAGQWDSEGELRDITIELPEIGLSEIEDIIITEGDRKIPLYDIAEISWNIAPEEIYRKNQVRIGKVTAHMKKNKPLDHIVNEIKQKMNTISFPVNYKYEITGEEYKRKEAFQNLKFALILSLILVYMVLASQFESLIHPFTIILSIPLAGVGTILIFFLLGKTFNIMAYIGIIMLVGIAVNDSIILVDAINQLKNEGLSRTDAILEAAQRRIRPIIMTSLTTILALLPLTFGIGEGTELRSPMALAVIGGLITSTLLTLVVIPCVYSVMDGFFEKFLSKLSI
ncbi:MAG TPA: efflux RND transporter permease subunit, partial [bacterium]|nr:efflux RND transporter permease subunit [bacterium]